MCYAFRLRKSSAITSHAGWLALLFSLSGGMFSLIVTGNLAAQTRSARIQQGPVDLVRGPKFKEGTLLVRFRPNVPQSAMQAAHSASRARVTGEFSAVDRLQVVQLPAGASVPDAVRQYRSDPNVLYAEPDYLVQAFDVTPNDPQFPAQWNLHNTGQSGGIADADIHAPQAWALSTGSSNVVVAVLDTGVDYTHPDLGAQIWTAPTAFPAMGENGVAVNCPAGSRGLDAFNNDCDPQDDNGHGTHVSGIIGAAGNNAVGVAGVNWNVTMLPCKMLNADGGGDLSGVIGCLNLVKYLKDSGVNIVATNNSWGGFDYSQALHDAIAAQLQDGILFIAAAGNNFSDNDQLPVYPANFLLPNVISVAASDQTDNLASFSDAGRHTVHISAPGYQILSTTPNNTYSVFSGTSMAAPHVAGVAALLEAQDSTRDWRAIKNLLLAGGDTIPSLNETITQKRLNAYGSLNCANSPAQSRLLPVPDTVSGSVGAPVVLSVLNINCGQPAGNVTVQVSPGGQTFDLLDDGSGNDLAADDGVYMGQWTPTAIGSYRLTFPDLSVLSIEVLEAYTASTTAFNYQSITGTSLNFGDDSVAQVSSPFPIPFGGGNFTTLYVNSNGTISFTDPFSNYDPQELVSEAPGQLPIFASYVPRPATLVAPFWMDLYPVKNSGQNVFWQVSGSAPNRELVVEWRNVQSFTCFSDKNATVTFEVVFQENTRNIIFNYADAEFGGTCASQDDGIAAAIGIQSSPGSSTQWSFTLGSVASGMALLWQSPPPTGPPTPEPTLTSVTPNSSPIFGPSMKITVNGTGFVTSSLVQWNGASLPTTYASATELTAIIPSLYFDPNAPRFSDYGTDFKPSITVFSPAPGGGTTSAITFTLLNLPPSITSISPASVPSGGFGISIVVTGSNLFGTTLYWNGQPIQFSGASDNEHAAGAISTSMIANPGVAQITAVTPAPGGGTSGALTFTITPVPQTGVTVATGTRRYSPGSSSPPVPSLPLRFLGWKQAPKYGAAYASKFSRPYGGMATRVANGVSSSGPVVAPQGSSAVSLSQPQSLPGFAFHPTLPAGYIPTAIATGDFNRDGKMDWVIANGGSNDLWLYLGNGDGTTQQPFIIPLAGRSPIGIAVADLRKIGVLDLIVAEADSNSIGVLLGNGDGTFGNEVDYFVPGPALSVAVSDFTGDGKLDLVAGIIGDDNSGPIALLPGTGTGSFGDPILSPNQNFFPAFTYATTSVLALDLNGDGLSDLMVVDHGAPDPGVLTQGIYMYVNEGDGTFKFAGPLVQNGPTFFEAVAVGDLNEDGCPDVITAEVAAGAVFAFWGHCDGTFQTTGNTILRQGPGDNIVALALADLNGDGHLDVVTSGAYLGETGVYGQVAGNLVSVMFGDGHGNLSPAQVVRGERSMFGLALTDLNGDGRPDIVTANEDTDTASVYMNNGQGGLSGPSGGYIGYPPPEVFNAPYTNFMVRDIDGDGKPDLGLFEFPGGGVEAWEFTVLLNDGTGKFGQPVRSPAAESSDFLLDEALADFRNTGKPDLLVLEVNAQTESNSAFVFSPNQGGGHFGPAKTTPIDIPYLGRMAVGDFDGDGKPDVAVTAPANNAAGAPVVIIFRGNGDGTFTKGFQTNFGQNVVEVDQIQAIDMNHDGKLDLVMSPNGSTLYELPGNGDGTFAPAKIIFTTNQSHFIADLNHDDYPDIITYAPTTSTSTFTGSGPVSYSVYLGQADGTFQLLQSYQPFGPAYLNVSLFADFNGDGNLDIASLEYDLFPLIQAPPSTGTNIYYRILAGNGDGTFTPTYAQFPMEKPSVPMTAADLNGDGRAELVEVDGFPASYHVIPAVPGPAFQLALTASPIVGTRAELQINLSVASSSPAILQLSASDSNVQIPPSVTIPPGTLFADVPFTIATNFNPSRAITLSATLGTQTQSITSYQTTRALARFQFVPTFVKETVPPTGRSFDFEPFLVSIGGYATNVTFSCQGLPAGASCLFGLNPVELPAGQEITTSLVMQAGPSTPIGSYAVQVVATDGFLTDQYTVTLTVADFTVSLAPASLSVVGGNNANFTVSVGSIGNWTDGVGLACQISPPNLPGGCGILNSEPPIYPLAVSTMNAAPGDYTVTVVGTADGVTHSSAPAILHVQGATIASDSVAATIAVGSSANFNLTVHSVNGLTDQFTFSCPAAGPSISCRFNPPSGILPANGNLATVLTVTVTSRPAMAVPAISRSGQGIQPWILMPFMLFCAALLETWRLFARRRDARFAGPFGLVLATVAFACALCLVSCGGAAVSSSSTGGTTPPPPPPPPPVVTTVLVHAASSSVSLTLNDIAITVP